MHVTRELANVCSPIISEETKAYLNSLNVKFAHYRIPHDKYDKIETVHNELSGHLSVDKTIEKLVSLKQT